MPHDRNGTVIQVGDTVNIPCRVKMIHLGEEYCNVDLEAVERMPPNMTINTFSLNAKQVIKAEG